MRRNQLSQHLSVCIAIIGLKKSQNRVEHNHDPVKRNWMFSPGIEPGTFRVLGGCDNHYTTKTAWRPIQNLKYINFNKIVDDHGPFKLL